MVSSPYLTMTETETLTIKTVVVVTVTATDPGATTASDGGVVVVYVTETASTTDQSGRPTNVIAVRFLSSMCFGKVHF